MGGRFQAVSVRAHTVIVDVNVGFSSVCAFISVHQQDSSKH